MQPSTAMLARSISSQKNSAVEPLSHEPALHVGERDDDRVDRARLDLRLQLVEAQHARDPMRPSVDMSRARVQRNTRLDAAGDPWEGDMSTGPTPGYHTSEDEKILHKLGYAQELFRAVGGFQNFAISFTIISILAGASPPTRSRTCREARSP